MAKLDKITIRGFKSIQKLEDFQLGDINVLIGANGAGKSSFIEALRALRAIVKGGFREYCVRKAYSKDLFFNGPSTTKTIELALNSSENTYSAELVLAADGQIIIHKEGVFDNSNGLGLFNLTLASDSSLPIRLEKSTFLIDSLRSTPSDNVKDKLDWIVYHFNETGDLQGMRMKSDFNQTHMLFSDGSNLAAFLYGMHTNHPKHFDLYFKTIRRVAPYIKQLDFIHAANNVELSWFKAGSDFRFTARHLSDGTIRFLCLAAILRQPNPPSLVIIDEPELGLHPEAVTAFAALVRSASARTQIILATQSPALVSEFDPEHIVTVDQIDGASQFKRLDAESLKDWLQEYSLGELWQKGNLAGGIQYE
jgi:predicted ATPase